MYVRKTQKNEVWAGVNPYYPVEKCNHAAELSTRYTLANSVWLQGNETLEHQVC